MCIYIYIDICARMYTIKYVYIYIYNEDIIRVNITMDVAIMTIEWLHDLEGQTI